MTPIFYNCALFFMLTTLLASCSGVGSQYEKPHIPISTKWSQPATVVPFAKHQVWWRHFHDPILNTLIEKISPHNLDLQIAKERVHLAKLEYEATNASFFPTAEAQAFPPNGTGANLTQVIGIMSSLELDLFGRLRQTKASAAALLESEKSNYDFFYINLNAEIANTYIEFRAAQAAKLYLQHDIAANKTMLSILDSRYHQIENVRYLDVLQQKTLIETELAELERTSAKMATLRHRIEILTGQSPGALKKLLDPYKPIPEVTTPITLNLPSDLLHRRPDILAAERRIAAAHAKVRVAIASLFPKISIGWILGWQTETLASNIFALQNPDSTLFGLFNAPFFNVTLYRNISYQKQQKILTILQYQLTIMKALNEVESLYDYCKHYKNSATHLKRAVAQKRLALKLEKNLYQNMGGDFNRVLRVEEDFSRTEILYLNDLFIYQSARVNLYKALGGDVGA